MADRWRSWAAAWLSLTALVVPCFGAEEETEEKGKLRKAVESSKVRLDQRYRFEAVDDAAERFEGRDGLASTLRSRLLLETGELGGFSVRAAVENVTAVGNDRLYANAGAGSLNNGVTDRPVVADPEITDLLEAALVYRRGQADQETKLQVGRQEMALDDWRFVGTVAWRQHFQTVDALRLDQSLGGKWTLLYSYLDRVHRITGSREDQDSHVLRLQGDVPGGQLTVHAFDLDYEEPQSQGLSSTTIGARYLGEYEVARGRILYEAQWALQEADAVGDLGDFEGDYRLLVGGWGGDGWSLRLRWEVLEGDGRRALQTPLSTLHKFNGWADRFLVTPADGLADLSLRFDQARGPWSYTLRWHRFEADRGAAHYGDEFDADLRWKLAAGPTLALRLAHYEAEDFSVDVSKAMLYASWRFDFTN